MLAVPKVDDDSGFWPTAVASQFNGYDTEESYAARTEKLLKAGTRPPGENLALAAKRHWPTATRKDADNAARHTTTKGVMHSGTSLVDATRNWGTPRGAEYKGCGPPGSKSFDHRLDRSYLDAQALDFQHGRPTDPTPLEQSGTGSCASGPSSAPLFLNPYFVEWLMGYPIGWTVSGPLETRSSPCTPRLPYGCC